jgi:DNA-binding transcriptional LysR family regulator
MTLRQLRYFLGAVELGSFTAVATQMHVTQPAVAEQIRQLERFLRVDLFLRLGRGVRLTEAGREFVEHARQVIAAADDAQDSVAQMRSLLGGTITFGAFGAPAHYRFVELIEDFAHRYPAVRLRLNGRNSSSVADDVRSGEVEAGLAVLPVDDDGLDVTPVARDEVVYVSADPQATQSAVGIVHVTAQPFVLYEAQFAEVDPTRRQFAERAQAAGLRIESHFEVEHLETAVQLASRGLANTYVPRAVASSDLFPSNLSTCSFEPPMYDTFALITRRGTRLSPAMAEFVRMVIRHMHTVASPLSKVSVADAS